MRADSGAPLDDAELDVSLERYEYAAAASIVNGTGGVGFAATCAFNREKSATKELLELLRPHVRWHDVADDSGGVADDADAAARAKGKKTSSPPPRLRLNPVKMPGRGFVFVRLSVAERLGHNSEQKRSDGPGGRAQTQGASAMGSASRANETEPETEPDEGPERKSVAKALGRATARALVALTASVRAGAVPAPRWVEKVMAVQATCAMPGAETNAPSDSGCLADCVARVVDCLDDPVVGVARDDAADGVRDDADVRFAVAFANRFKGRGGDVRTEFKRYTREAVVPAVAAAAETALATARFRRRRRPRRPAPGARGDERAEDDANAVDRADAAQDLAEGKGEETAVSGTNDGRPKGKSSGAGATVDLRDPDVTFFVEVLSVPAEGLDGFVERLAIGAAAKRDGVFELKRGAIRPVALKRANEATR